MKKNYDKIIFTIEDVECPFDEETMWGIDKGNGYYQIDNIPFYTENLALGDLVKGKKIADQIYYDGLVKTSGHSTVQMIFFDKSLLMETKSMFKEIGCTSEVFNDKTQLAIDIPKIVSYETIWEILEDGLKKGKWDYKEACLGFIDL